MPNSVRVLGMPQLLAKFLATAVAADVAVEGATSLMATDVASAARAMAPVGETGDLVDSIEADGNVVSVGVPYAGFVEYGTSDTDAQPYLRPAEDENNGETALQLAAVIITKVF